METVKTIGHVPMAAEIRIPEGRYKGQTLEQVPAAYLARVAGGRVRIAPNLAALMEDELAERGQEGR